MGRPPSSGAPAFRFLPSEVAEMEARLQQLHNSIPSRAVLQSLADKFSASPERAGRVAIQPKQVWNWFQNRRYSHRAKNVRPAPQPPSKMTPTGADRLQHATASSAFRAAQAPTAAAGAHPGKSGTEVAPVEFEAKSARDGAWYDVAAFLSHRMFESGDPEVRVRFAGFGAEEDEWINVRKCVRQRSLPCEATECVAVLPGDLILCFQEGKEQALYFDAIVLDAQRRRHDEIVPLRKVCRRPETDYRLQILHAARAAVASTDAHTQPKEVKVESASNENSSAEQKPSKQHKMMNVNTDKVTVVSDQDAAGKNARPTLSAKSEICNDSSSDVAMKDAEPSSVVEVDDEVQVVDKVKEGE
ncbi:hypothetical protein PR202_gb22868 [Eleusine coracana subsp. coracana]|uniref:Homeobox domain-containing protein n=1 Tax=Eleusine coracana subsp. coracana TaxID=191504 RepID=A0AAV5FHN4_ELECO|nr:hypothetical protein PR202_gb22868 [Eleusine coracana subsp. coracana]